MRMDLVLFVVLDVTTACLITGLFCRDRIAKTKRLTWWPMWAGIAAATLVTVAVSTGLALFTKSFWMDTKMPDLVALLYVCGFCVAIAAVPSAGTLSYYMSRRRK